MPLKAYIGRPRHGKTYEVVTVVIYISLSQGRRVVSNIAGLNRSAMLERFLKNGGDPDKFGELVMVTHDEVKNPLFWRTDADRDKGVDSFIQPGDVLALDEIWRFWSGFGLRSDDGDKRPERVMNFFRMHGHFTHPTTGYCCEIALITQDLNDIHRSIKGIIDQTFLMTKLTAIGSSKRYRVDIYEKTKVTRAPLRQLQRSYNPEYFEFYNSHSQRKEGDADAIEENPDDRGNLLKGALFKIVIPLALVVGCFAVWTVVQFFRPKELQTVKVSTSETATVAPVAVSPAKNTIDESERWRVIGWFDQPMRVILSDGNRTRIIQPPDFRLAGLDIETFLPNGEAVTAWTGSRKAGIIEGAQP